MSMGQVDTGLEEALIGLEVNQARANATEIGRAHV